MSITRKQLVQRYVSSIYEGDAALFIGAGFSRSAGFVDWKGLLRDCANEIGLDVDRESDLVAVAQYYLNRQLSDRSRLNQIIKAEFDGEGTSTTNHKIISQLPISFVWTSNFDNLLENAYKKAGRKVTVKSRDADLGIPTKDKDVTVYKMHGDIARPDEVIICKDDYERYAIKHPLFQNALEGDLIQKTFLFLGFSFTDPHLEYMLGHLRSLLKESKREHFTIMREVKRSDFPNGSKGKKEFEYSRNRQSLQIDDLNRYSIKTLLIKEYDEITEILEEIQNTFYQKNIFVSGSASFFGDFGEERLKEFCNKFGSELIKRGFNLVSGFGLTVGNGVIMGALNSLYEDEQKDIDKRLILRPFPFKQLVGKEKEEKQKKYREDMISKCGFAVFIAGNINRGGIVENESRGVLEEFEIARNLKKTIIPIGSTEFAASDIWKQLSLNLAKNYPNTVTTKIWAKLNNPALDNEKIIATIFEIIEKVKN